MESPPKKQARKHNARPLPKGLTQEMMPKYVVYYNECYNKEKQSFREFFKIEKHPKLSGKSPIIGSKSAKFSLPDKLRMIKAKLKELEKKDNAECTSTTQHTASHDQSDTPVEELLLV